MVGLNRMFTRGHRYELLTHGQMGGLPLSYHPGKFGGFNSLPEFTDLKLFGRAVSVANRKFGDISWPINPGSELCKGNKKRKAKILFFLGGEGACALSAGGRVSCLLKWGNSTKKRRYLFDP